MATWYFLSDYDAGHLRSNDPNWDAAHDAALADEVYVDLGHFLVGAVYSIWYRVHRGGVFWPNTGILNGTTINSATIKVRKEYDAEQPDAALTFGVVSGEDLTKPLVLADYGELLARITTYATAIYPAGGVGVSEYIDLVLDAIGISKINKTGTTAFGFRTQKDIDSIPPEAAPGDWCQRCKFGKTPLISLGSAFGRTSEATDVTPTSATIGGFLEAENSDVYALPLLVVDYDGIDGSDLDVRFEWHESGGEPSYSDWIPNAVFYTNYTHALSGLKPDTLYYFSLQVRKDGVIDYAKTPKSFQTLPRCSDVEDGYIESSGPDWDAAHDAASGSELNDTDVSVVVMAGYHIGPSVSIIRGFLYFDTSDISPEATIISAKLALYPEVVFEVEAGCATLHVVEGVQAVPLELADYGNHLPKTTSGGSIAFGDWVPDSYNEIELNATGISWINKGGLTKLCLRVAADKNDTPLTLEGENGVVFNSAETGPDYCPKLSVTYELPPPVVPPTVTTGAVSDIEATTATGNGDITDNGGENCDHRGIVYGTTSKDDPGNTAPAVSGYDYYEDETNAFGTGLFTRSLTGLTPRTKYYARAYAHNSAGYSYGGQVSFTTIAAYKGNIIIDQLIYQHAERMRI